MSSDEYPVTPRNRVRQIRQNAAYDKDSVHGVLDAAPYASVAFIEDGAPVVVPMLFGREDECIFLHGARKARIVKLLEENERVALNVTLVDALVIARSAFNSSMNYRSATVFGTPRLVEGADAKLHAMKVISEHVMPGRWDELRAPLETEVKMTGIIAVAIDSASAKIADDSCPDDEETDYEIPVWAGILPLESRYTTLIGDDRLIEGVAPSAALRALERTKL
jgi:nitroimidazol reductase NimA-like FMN-containing flavoprotein (pyridoxamine 5'-phosphate oxidase superfamily)